MAKTILNDSAEDKLFISFPITKSETDADGNLVVYGKATDESVDSDRQIVKGDWSGPALKDWLDTGANVRVQHNPALYPAGKGLSVEVTPDGHFVKSLVVEPTAIKLVKAGVLQAYSVGISRPVIERDITGKAQGGIIKGGEIFEISLVDRPANKNCAITLSKSESELIKSDDGDDRTTWTYGDLEGQLVQSMISKSAGPETAAEWALKRAEWLNEEPDPSQSTQGPEYLAKRAEWQRWMHKGETGGLAEDGYQTWLTKRQMDPKVGGGADRDKIPAADFAGRDRSFPIVTPGDVSDAASSIGRAGSDNYSSDQLRENIERIAHRKGPSFVAELPASWTESTKAKKPKKSGSKPAFMIGANEGGKTDEIPVKKDAGTCPQCGSDMNSSGICACCGKDPCTCPKDSMVGKGDGGECSDCDQAPCVCKTSKRRKKGKKGKPFMSGEGSDATLGEGGTKLKSVVTKCHCGQCGTEMGESDLFCSQCGSAAAGGDMGEGGADSGGAGPVEKSLMPTRSGGKKDMKPAGAHREPDGDTSVEQLEGDAGMDTDKDPVKDKVPASVDAKGKKKANKSDQPVDYSLKRMHDALCAAYHSDEVFAEYPSLKSVTDAVDPSWFKDEGWAEEIAQLKSADPALIEDARAELHKMFMDSYPTLRLKPGAPPKPGSFTRPYISTGHAPLTATGKKPKMPAGGRTASPNDFDRGSITAGHERPSPANKNNNTTGSVSTGSGRELYASASRQYATNRMKAIHDHIEMTTTGLCPMASSASVLPPDNGAGNGPAVRQPLNTEAGAAASTKSFQSVDPDALATMIDERVREATKSIKKKYKGQIETLESELDELGRMPDPTQAPVRGTVRKTAASATTPVERRNLAIEAQDKAAQAEKAAYIDYSKTLATSGDPETREKAYKAMTAEGMSHPFYS